MISKLIHHFITACMLIVAAALAVALFAAGKVEPPVAAFLGVIAFLVAILVRWSRTIQGRQTVLAQEIGDNRGVIEAMLGRADRIEARLKAVETAIHRSGGEETSAAIATLGSLVKDLAHGLSEQEARFEALSGLAGRAQAAATARTAAKPASLADALDRGSPASQMEPTGLPSLPPDLAEALDAGRIEIHLQPIVTLPQRKVRLYEALPYLRTAEGRLFAPSDYRVVTGAAEASGSVDEVLLLQCVQIIRRLLAKNRELMIACNLSPAWLASPGFTADAIEFFEGSHELASQMIFPIEQSQMQIADPETVGRLRRLAATGCRFSLEAVTDLRLDARALAGRGIRFIKVPAAVLLGEGGGSSEIHAADLSGLLARFGIDLIATGIESERLVADLLDFDARLAQGNLFSPPRPVRAEVVSDEAPPPPPAAEAPRPVRAPEPVPLRTRPVLPAEAALPVSVEAVRQASPEGDPAPPAPEDPAPRRSAWDTLARRVGSRDRTG